MRILLTRISDQRHGLEIVRSDGSRDAVELVTRHDFCIDAIHGANDDGSLELRFTPQDLNPEILEIGSGAEKVVPGAFELVLDRYARLVPLLQAPQTVVSSLERLLVSPDLISQHFEAQTS